MNNSDFNNYFYHSSLQHKLRLWVPFRQDFMVMRILYGLVKNLD